VTGDTLTNLVISSGVLGLIGWGIKKTLDNAMSRWTDRIEKSEQQIEKQRVEHEDTWKTFEQRLGEMHDDFDRRLETKASREDFIRDSSRTRMTLEKLLEGQARMEGAINMGNRIAAAIEAVARDKHG
jgi:hypothetical protein